MKHGLRLMAAALLGVLLALAAGLALAMSAFAQDAPCGPVIFSFEGAAQCARLGRTAPCEYRCGTLCWKPGRAQWVWRQDKKGCPALPPIEQPTPAPTPRPTASPRPTPTEKVCALPCCVFWQTGKCTCPCPDKLSLLDSTTALPRWPIIN